MNHHHIYWLCIILLLGLGACVPPGAVPPGPEDTAGDSQTDAQIEIEANRELVFLLAGDDREAVSTTEQPVILQPEQGLAVDDEGWAILRFGDRMTLELLRGTELLQIQQTLSDAQDSTVTVAQNGGTLVADLTLLPEAQNSVVVQTAFATVAATNARFAIVREANSPLEWVLGLDSLENGRLEVTAGRTTQTVEPGQARWISSSGPPSPAVVIEQSARAWLESARDNISQSEIGEVLLKPADVLASTSLLTSTPRPGETLEFGRNVHGSIMLTLDPQGIFGDPTYRLDDCNRDGTQDLAVTNGVLHFDFRPLLARVHALDATVLNQDIPGNGLLQARGPARDVIGQQQVDVPAGEIQTLSLRPEQPVHFAELRLANACFLGLSLTPPSSAPDEPAAVRSAAEPAQSDVVVNVLSSTSEEVSRSPQFQALPANAGPLQIDGLQQDWDAFIDQRGLVWSSFSTVTYDGNCANRFPGGGSGSDLAAQVQFAYDDQNLYAAFLVEDDGVVPYSGADERYFLGDSPQLLLDLELAGDFEDTQLSSDDIQIDILPGSDDSRAALWQLSTLTSRQLTAAQVATTRYEAGYFVEIALPWSALGITPQPGDRLGMVASVSDNDTTGTNAQECIISTSPGRDWQNPTSWGSLLLLPSLTE